MDQVSLATFMALFSGKNSMKLQDMDNPEHRTLLEGVIVLEEFCKEVAAIAFVKHHAAINGFENFSWYKNNNLGYAQ